MRSLAVILIVASVSAWAARKIESCDAYLLSPVDLQSSTRVALRVNPSRLQIAAAEDRIENYVSSAPLESAEVLKYLIALRQDIPPAIRAAHAGAFGAFVNLYLMRPGNEDFANQRLETFINNFWEDLLVYRRTEPGQVRLEREVKFLERMSALNPGSVESLWRLKMPDFLREILSYNEINRSFASTVGLLARGRVLTGGDRERFEYQMQVAGEAAIAPLATDVAGMMKLRLIRDPRFAGNDAFVLDSKLWSGGGVFIGESPVGPLIFLTRLARRLGLWTPEQRQFETLAEKLRGGPDQLR